MKLLKRSGRNRARISLVLIDWSVRESFHLLDYLDRQTVDRDDFEVLLVEYYSRRSAAAAKHEAQIDTWLLLEAPEDCCHHKHLMYNAGLVLARGEIVAFLDSDAMVSDTFIRSILESFDRDREIVLHIDQFRNNRRDFYPFSYPSLEEVRGDGCVNNVGGRTTGLAEIRDPLHVRNYGACMCARRDDLVALGGADEHIDYLGHMCGPYDMTFRLFNRGRREVWHQSEFTYHTWHPGSAGENNHQGPHDGRQMSSAALQALSTGRTAPYVENPAIRSLRQRRTATEDAVLEMLIDPRRLRDWRYATIRTVAALPQWKDAKIAAGDYHHRGFRVAPVEDGYRATPIARPCPAGPAGDAETLTATDHAAIIAAIDRATPPSMLVLGVLGRLYILFDQAYERLVRFRRAR